MGSGQNQFMIRSDWIVYANAAAAAFWYEDFLGCGGTVWAMEGPSRLFIYWLARGGYKKDDYGIPDVEDGGSNRRDARKASPSVEHAKRVSGLLSVPPLFGLINLRLSSCPLKKWRVNSTCLTMRK